MTEAEYCWRCNYKCHMCPGCGVPTVHGVSACLDCEEANIGRNVFRHSTGTLKHTAHEIVKELRAHGFGEANAPQRQVLALAEECGEFVGAYRRWAGQARRTGTFDDVQAELADVVIVAFVTAQELGIDLDEAIARKVGKLFERGWRDAPAK